MQFDHLKGSLAARRPKTFIAVARGVTIHSAPGIHSPNRENIR
jgi:hypothetical protein